MDQEVSNCTALEPTSYSNRKPAANINFSAEKQKPPPSFTMHNWPLQQVEAMEAGPGLFLCHWHRCCNTWNHWKHSIHVTVPPGKTNGECHKWDDVSLLSYIKGNNNNICLHFYLVTSVSISSQWVSRYPELQLITVFTSLLRDNDANENSIKMVHGQIQQDSGHSHQKA